MSNFDRRLLLPYLQDAFIAELLCSILANEVELSRLKIHASDKGHSPVEACELRLQLRILQQRLTEAQKLRNQVYAFNILPTHCRNIYCVYYLYHRFRSGKETDLSEAVKKMDLADTRWTLDRIILNEGRALLNQRFQAARRKQQDPAIGPENGLVEDFLLAADYIEEL